MSRREVPTPELRCPRCHTELERFWSYCPTCGRHLEWKDTLRETGAPCVEKPFRVQQFISVVEKTMGKAP